MLNLPAMPARLTHEGAAAFVSQCEAALRNRGAAAAPKSQVVLDVAALTDFDSSAVAVMLAVRRAAQARGLALQVAGVPPRLRELSNLYGVGELLTG